MPRRAVDKDGYVIEDDFFSKDQMKRLSTATAKANASKSKSAKSGTKSSKKK